MTAALRDMLWDRIVSHLLSIDDSIKQAWLQSFTAQQKIELPATPSAGYRGVNWEQVREMAAANIEIGAHTRTHPSLGRISEAQLQYEVAGCC